LTRTASILLILLIILSVITAIFWFEPDIDILASLSALNPFGGVEETATVNSNDMNAQSSQNRSDDQSAVPDSSSADDAPEEEEEELTPFEEEIRQRHESYQTKVYTYEPYEPAVMRNPFERMVSSVYLEDEEEKVAEELATEEDVRRFVQPELPPGSKFTGLISSGEAKLAILEIDNETYIAKEGDLIMDKFLIKSIQEDKVTIDINGHEISLQLGGGEASNE
jgi:Tfp pilus assembly protein PilP